MNSLKSLLTAAALAGCLVPTGVSAQDPAPLKIFTAVEVEFGTQSGKVYQLQGSSNLVDWVDVGSPIFGSGRDINQVFSTRNGGTVLFGAYRLQDIAAPTNGLAPWSLAGVTLSLDDTPGEDLMQFTDGTKGVDLGVAPDPFSYVFTRLDADTVRADVDYGNGKKDVLTLTFSAAARGTWVREEYRKEKLKDRDLGVFSVVSNSVPGGIVDPGTPPPPVDPGTTNAPAEPPASLVGLVYQFQSGEHPDRLEFKDASNGVELGDDVSDDEPNNFTYSYTATGTNSAKIVITFKPGRHDDYELTFASAGRGMFIRREFRDDQLKDTDNGAFSLVGRNAGNDGGDGGNGGGGTQADVPVGPSLEGVRYRFSTGEDPDILTFSSATSGIEEGDSDLTPFSYTYVKTGASSARLTVRFKVDKWDEYDLEFAGGNRGTFTRREYDKSELKDTDTGSFGSF